MYSKVMICIYVRISMKEKTVLLTTSIKGATETSTTSLRLEILLQATSGTSSEG